MKKTFILFIILVSSICLVSCNKISEDDNMHKITYVCDGGELPNDAIYKFTDGSKVVLPIPTKEDYVFIAWYDKDGNIVNDLTGVETNVTLYAKWEEFIAGIKYNIEYELNGGYFTGAHKARYTSGEEYILPIPVKTAHIFISWYDSETNQAIDKITNTMQGDKYLYAVFEEAIIVRNINYHLDGGVLADSSCNSYIEGVGLDSLPVPTKEDYLFKGWFTTDTFETEVFSISSETNGDINLYAKWKNNKLENVNFGILGDSISSFYSSDSEFNSIFTASGQYYFPRYDINSVNQTWWYKTVEELNAKLLVSNSYSGGTVHANGISSGNNDERIAKFNCDGQVPDVIIVYLGINDTGGNFTKEFFKTEYQGMIDKIQAQFPQVQIFICTLAYTSREGLDDARLRYNEAIVEIAESEKIPLIDFASAWTNSNYASYLSDGLHPSINGMNKLSEIAVLKIKEFYNMY